jgi:hypothetical protein
MGVVETTSEQHENKRKKFYNACNSWFTVGFQVNVGPSIACHCLNFLMSACALFFGKCMWEFCITITCSNCYNLKVRESI